MKIFAFVSNPAGAEDVTVYALSEFGEMMASYTASNLQLAKHGIGIGSAKQHIVYEHNSLDGYELIWVDNPGEHIELKRAMGLFYKAHDLNNVLGS